MATGIKTLMVDAGLDDAAEARSGSPQPSRAASAPAW